MPRKNTQRRRVKNWKASEEDYHVRFGKDVDEDPFSPYWYRGESRDSAAVSNFHKRREQQRAQYPLVAFPRGRKVMHQTRLRRLHPTESKTEAKFSHIPVDLYFLIFQYLGSDAKSVCCFMNCCQAVKKTLLSHSIGRDLCSFLHLLGSKKMFDAQKVENQILSPLLIYKRAWGLIQRSKHHEFGQFLQFVEYGLFAPSWVQGSIELFRFRQLLNGVDCWNPFVLARISFHISSYGVKEIVKECQVLFLRNSRNPRLSCYAFVTMPFRVTHDIWDDFEGSNCSERLISPFQPSNSAAEWDSLRYYSLQLADSLPRLLSFALPPWYDDHVSIPRTESEFHYIGTHGGGSDTLTNDEVQRVTKKCEGILNS